MIHLFSIKMLITFVAVLSLPLQVFAASTIILSASGESVYQLQGVNMENAAAIDITVSYDTADLSNPRFAAGPLISGAMTEVNPNVPGTVRIAIIRTTPVTGSGTIATISFDRTGESAGKIVSLSAKLANLNGTPLPVLVKVNNPSDTAPTIPAATASAIPSGPAPAQTSSNPLFLPFNGVIATQPTVTHSEAEQGAVPSKDLVAVANKPVTTPSVSETASRKIYAQKSVQELFREYKGERSPKALISLFAQAGMIGFQQEPAVVLSDGKSTVRVTFISAADGRKPSDIAVMGAKLLNLRPDPNSTNTWVLDLQPFKGEYQASVTILQGAVLIVYPLVVAPKVEIALERSKKPNEAEFQRFLAERGTKGKPKYDLNNDHKRDYIDDYIYTANYIVTVDKGKKR